MRAVLFAAATLGSLSAAADPAFRDVIVAPAHHTDGPQAFTQVSHLIYMNNCLPNGCTVYPGNDDSLTQRSSIPQTQSHLAGYAWGPDSWNTLVQCMKDMYAPFDVQITDQDPGTSVPHFELMVGGHSTDIGIEGAGGVAPFIPCDGQLQDNVISFVFAAETSDLDYLCWAAAQETSHVFGLDHEMLATDPMTYLSPPVKKPGFQNMDVSCGEYQDRTCWCGNATQNSAQYLTDTFGPAQLEPATLSIDSPADGAWIIPGAEIHATAHSQLSVATGELDIDGASSAQLTAPPLVFATPSTLAAGDHTLQISATDVGGRTFSASIGVHVVAACASGCAHGFGCLGGYCLPESDQPGGLGATCTNSADCITGTCATDGTSYLCTGACDAGGTCPAGYACASAAGQASGVCWPSASKSGGCTTGTGGSPWLVLAGLALLVVARRRL